MISKSVYLSWFCCSSSPIHKHNQYDKCNNNNSNLYVLNADCLYKNAEDYYLENSYFLLCSLLCKNIITQRSIVANFSTLLCAEGRTGRLCGTCTPSYGVPINQLNRCVHCDKDPLLG